MRTLVVSDFHLGTRLGHDTLRSEPVRERFIAALDGIDRLVLLGDVVELLEGRPRHALEVASPLLRAIGETLGPEREVLIVPGNHDRHLVLPWIRSTGRRLEVSSVVPQGASLWLARLVARLAPARVEVRYPGVWLTDRTWATHGHYLDRHLIPGRTYGIPKGRLRRPVRDRATPHDYERRRTDRILRAEVRLASALPRPSAPLVRAAGRTARAAPVPKLRADLVPAPFAPATARLHALQLRRAALPALARVVGRLGIDAEYVVFGHVHRLGPVPDDDPGEWTGPLGTPQLLNTGSWVFERRLLHGAEPPHDYWPGGGVRVDGDEPPRPVRLLEGLPVGLLRR